jgi:hypothetical protein
LPPRARLDRIDHAVAISLGTLYRCAIRQDGIVSCWGTGPNTCDLAATRDQHGALVGIGPAIGIAAASGFACALEATGKVYCWGHNDRGELGDATRVARCDARPVTGVDDAVELAASAIDGYACARRKTGGIVCWGDDAHGQLGRAPVQSCELRGKVFDAPTPKPVPCALTPVPVR